MRRYFYNLITDKNTGFGSRIITPILAGLSIIYGLIVMALAFFRRRSQRRINCQVISVGNITLGGTGKTSLVEYIARCLKEHKKNVAILSRGYKRKNEMGDEPFMLQQKLKGVPVIVDADRIRGGKLAIEKYAADTLILDDGFQQWGIYKDLEVVTIDALYPFGNGRLLPRGVLREPLSALKRADIFVLTKTNLGGDMGQLRNILSKINPKAMVVESAHRPLGFYELRKPQDLLGIDILKNKAVTLFSGIGDPDSFEKLIAALDINIALSFKFSDHHNYCAKDLENIFAEAKKKNSFAVVTTEKDAARITPPLTFDLRPLTFVLRIGLEIKDNDSQRFLNRLLTLYPV